MIEPYDWAGGREAMLRFGPGSGPVVVAALPLFEEANRTRAFVVAILRALADRGIAGVLPELPGTGDSLIPTDRIAISDLRAGFAAAARTAGKRAYSLAVRSGALLDGTVMIRRRWHFAPQTGPELLRALHRMHRIDGMPGYGGHRLPESFLEELPECHLEPARTVRLDTDMRPSDHSVPGRPLWRLPEPTNDLTLAELLAADIAAWVQACEA
ncbi:hypothetical protein ACNFJ7_06620 [Sphingomonas sp. HT-1]|uniref:hypothetical protein n=1 Tax=unclassified Sphingomonas TaxID=196159 RepID=UPI0002E80FA4|nr:MULTISPECIES: hypothetical protein [unclassified Sphingomonas]KTF70107.1 hypothetical protein ATB93_05755 [Sphingomonas sp. WG]